MTAIDSSRPATLGVPVRFGWGIGSLGMSLMFNAISLLLLRYLVDTVGVAAALAGFLIGAAKIYDAVTDPLVGSISDSFHSCWGRRHPFMYTSALPMAVCFYLLFNPPELGQTALFVWLCTFAVGVRASMTLYSIPSNSMVAELTERLFEGDVAALVNHLVTGQSIDAAELDEIRRIIASAAPQNGRVNGGGGHDV